MQTPPSEPKRVRTSDQVVRSAVQTLAMRQHGLMLTVTVLVVWLLVLSIAMLYLLS